MTRKTARGDSTPKEKDKVREIVQGRRGSRKRSNQKEVAKEKGLGRILFPEGRKGKSRRGKNTRIYSLEPREEGKALYQYSPANKNRREIRW